MEKYQINIELLSDMCVSDGGAYNSLEDTSICYDDYGFPYIPAKRIRGCLRECAQELKDIGLNISPEGLFGKEGNSHAKIRIGNARLKDYAAMRKKVKENGSNPLFHHQNILNRFSYIRTQTSIDYDTGIADEGSLRTMRVINKGNVFISDIIIENDENEIYESLNKCCKILSHMGIARTRGLGEVHVSLDKADKASFEDERFTHGALVDGATKIVYRITLQDPVICKSVNGGETRTLDYIDGGKILGIIAGMFKDDFISLIDNGNIICSNAYIADGDERYTEVPASFYSIKNTKGICIDKCYGEKQQSQGGEPIQLNEMKHCYVRYDDSEHTLRKKDVLTESRYHHKRPEDKSVGRAVENNDNSGFYQMSSIREGQSFIGFISGNANEIKEVYDRLIQNDEFRIGYARYSEYGNVSINVLRTEKEENRKITCRDFSVNLVSPAILYNDNAMYTTDIKELIAEVNAALGIEQKDVNPTVYVHYTTVSGYQVSWGMPKPVISAFDKGTVLKYHLEKEITLDIPNTLMIGERTSEGFGETEIRILNGGSNEFTITGDRKDENGQVSIVIDPDDHFTYDLFKTEIKKFIKAKAVENAETDKIVRKSDARAVVSNMLMMVKENRTIEEVQKNIDDRFGKTTGNKPDKRNVADNIIEIVNDNNFMSIITEFCDENNINNNSIIERKDIIEEMRMIYLTSLLTEIKYRIRSKDSAERIGKEGKINE